MKSRLAFYTVITIWFMLSIWCIDVSVTSLNLGLLTNGFWILTPTQGYHLGIWSAIISFSMMIFYRDHLFLNSEKK